MKFMKTSLWRVSKISYEMITNVRLCLSYDPLKWDLIAFRMKISQLENVLLTRTLLMTLRLRAKILVHIWVYDFYDTTLSSV